jgi:hypothetical protein
MMVNGWAKSAMITGRAMLTMLESTVDMKIPTATKRKKIHLLGEEGGCTGSTF